ncbi:MAG: hypothetical protein M1836_001481 [Candelina mexicana]|nr:MAG: hypothetical protein M1836_001481 [Candelina mexicana]
MDEDKAFQKSASSLLDQTISTLCICDPRPKPWKKIRPKGFGTPDDGSGSQEGIAFGGTSCEIYDEDSPPPGPTDEPSVQNEPLVDGFALKVADPEVVKSTYHNPPTATSSISAEPAFRKDLPKTARLDKREFIPEAETLLQFVELSEARAITTEPSVNTNKAPSKEGFSLLPAPAKDTLKCPELRK